ncbi:hypothetical protein F4779DRAFT_605219 [Xylariaceae sp. FL0662B]|nr:hypothetical protein F4779DRAFT_605219 [Xylariaceae sp. FL0662B]
MDVISSAAAVAQLLGQIISIWQHVEMARECVKAAPKRLGDTTAQLCSLSDTIKQIQHEPGLRTAEIHSQIKLIDGVAAELKRILEKMTISQQKSPLRQGLLAFRRGGRDESKLNDVLGRLEKAKTDLTLRIHVVHVGITEGIAKNVERFREGPEVDGHQAMGEKFHRHLLLLEGNITGEGSDQINGIIGIESSRAATTAKIMHNQALCGGRQKNLIITGNSSSHLLEDWERGRITY